MKRRTAERNNEQKEPIKLNYFQNREKERKIRDMGDKMIQ